MRYRTLGKTGLDLSILGFGSSPFGDVFGQTVPADIQKAVDVAIDYGINFFDTSPYYGLTLAEERLGQALGTKRSKVIVATKFGRDGLAEFNFSRTNLRVSLEASLRRLRTDYVDVLQAHDIEFAHEREIIEETIPAMRELQSEGKARFIGITAYPVQLLKRVAKATHVDTILSYCRYSLLNNDMETVLAPLSEEAGTGLINASPLMMGVLTRGGPPPWHPASSELRQAAQRAADVAEASGTRLETLALQFSVQPSFVTTTLVGMSNAEQVEENVAVVERAPDPELLRRVKAAVGDGFATTWASGLPENAD